MLKCILCECCFDNKKGISNHLYRVHGLNGLEREESIIKLMYDTDYINSIIVSYKNEELAFYMLPKDFKKYITYLGIKRSSSQERKTKRYAETYKNSIFELYGVSNISQSEEIKNRKNKKIIENYGSLDSYYSQQIVSLKNGYSRYVEEGGHKLTSEKVKQTCLSRYGNENFGQGKVAKEKARETKKQTIASWVYEERLQRTEKAREAVTHRGGYVSKPEKRVRKALIDMDIINAKYNKMILGYSWDIQIDNILIEVQGTMWHANKKYYKENDLIMGKILAKDIWEKDERKQNKAITNGYIVIEIWEDEIKNLSDNELIILMREKLNERNISF